MWGSDDDDNDDEDEGEEGKEKEKEMELDIVSVRSHHNTGNYSLLTQAEETVDSCYRILSFAKGRR